MHVDFSIHSSRAAIALALPSALMALYCLINLSMNGHGVIYSLFGAIIMAGFTFLGASIIREMLTIVKHNRSITRASNDSNMGA